MCPYSVFMENMCHVLDKVCGPTASLLEEQLMWNELEKKRLLKKKSELEKQLGDFFENSV